MLSFESLNFIRKCQSKCGILNEFDYFDSQKCMAVNGKRPLSIIIGPKLWTLLMNEEEIHNERAHQHISVCINEG